VSDMSFTECKVTLEVGETLFLYTDGLTEARRNGEQFGEDRVFGMLDETTKAEPRLLVADAVAACEAFTGGVLRDDLAVFALQRLDD
jgi:phosphoserine phosphatase RsbU/P